jgi:photosystem II stability/assembly factor-like uncharacterized protein
MRWPLERVNNSSLLSDFDFDSATEGWVVGSAGTLLHTVDGGATWSSMATGLSDLYAVKVTDVSAAPVPEPETCTLLLAGLGVLGAMVRRCEGCEAARARGSRGRRSGLAGASAVRRHG